MSLTRMHPPMCLRAYAKRNVDSDARTPANTATVTEVITCQMRDVTSWE